MKILLAETAGYCFGVDRAVNMVYNLLERGDSVCTLGPIIHNPQLVDELKEKGVSIVSSPEETPPGSTLVISSHGAPAGVYSAAADIGCSIADATCPYVAKIHRIVKEAAEKKRKLLVAGDPRHTEIKGVVGHFSGESLIFRDESELKNLIDSGKIKPDEPLTVISQTTFNTEIWNICKETLKKVCTNLIVFDTICKATSMRQKEASDISRLADVMIVVGGRQSSNTAKLSDVCQRNAPTYLIETAAELPMQAISGAGLVGVTAGASTPAHIIKEVLKTMSENVNAIKETDEEVKTSVPEEDSAEKTPDTASDAAPQKSFDDMTFEEALEFSLSRINYDQKVHGVVMSVSPNEVQVDIGRKQAGIIPANELSDDPGVNPSDIVKPGDELDLVVIKTNDSEGITTLSRRRFESLAGWENVLKAKDSGETVEGTVRNIVKGGVQAVSGGIRIFIPASHASLSRNDNLEELIGKKVDINIIDINRGRRAVGSIRKFLRAQRKEQEDAFWNSVEVGQVYEGTVKSMTSYGAFVDLGAVDGMIHISELSWSRIKTPADVLSIGDKVTVTVKGIDTEKHKISLGYKKAEDNPWTILRAGYEVGQTVPVKVVNIKPYGAFVNVIDGIDGLVHISQIANHRIENPASELKIGQELDAKITEIDYDNKRISLSIRALLEDEQSKEDQEIVEQYNKSVAESEDTESVETPAQEPDSAATSPDVTSD